MIDVSKLTPEHLATLRNARHYYSTSATGYFGVVQVGGANRRRREGSKCYRAQISILGKPVSIGMYATAREAADAYDNALYYLIKAGHKTRTVRRQADEDPPRYNYEFDYLRLPEPPPATGETLRVVSAFIFMRRDREWAARKSAASESPSGKHLEPTLHRLRKIVQRISAECQSVLAELDSLVTDPLSPVTSDPEPVTGHQSQATNCAACGQRKHTPLRNDTMGGYVCLTCIDKELERLQAALAPVANQPEPIMDLTPLPDPGRRTDPNQS